MLNIGSILLAVFILGVLILVHELGHFVAGRLLKFDIYEFAIGFGPKIWKRKKGMTTYSIRALPLGGFVAFDNEENLEKGELAFRKQPLWKRLIAILAGPVMNIIVAYIVVVVILTTVGFAGVAPTINAVDPGSPAQIAGLQSGDTFVEVDGKRIKNDVLILHDAIANSEGREMKILIKRDNQAIEMMMTPAYDEESGRHKIGVNLSEETVRHGLFKSMGMAFGFTGNMIKQLLAFLGRLVSTGEGAGDVAGPIGSVGIISDIARSQDLSNFLVMVAFISINLGVFNLLPIPPLDGSKLLLMGVEGVRGKPLSLEKESVIQLIGVVAFILLAVVLTYRDLARIFGGG